MDEHNHDDVDAFIDSLSEDECRRILAVLMYGEHRCHGARVGCCGAFRCEPCHITHLRSKHGERAVGFWNKISQSSNLTWKEPRYRAEPESTNHNARSKRRKEVTDPSRKLEVPSEIEQMAEAIERMRKVLREQGYQV